jgi:hypothetical protein
MINNRGSLFIWLQELNLYKVQLDNAQREIFRAQEVINQVVKEKQDAEEEAVYARAKARKFKEENLVMIAREEGRRQGFEEGLSRGRRIGFEEGRTTGLGRDEPQESEEDAESIQIRRPKTPEHRHPVVEPRPLRTTTPSVMSICIYLSFTNFYFFFHLEIARALVAIPTTLHSMQRLSPFRL